MTRTYRIGMLTPSANTCVEPVTYGILLGLPDVSAHFSRLCVRRTGLDAEALGQFDIERFLDAARLLADADLDVIAWNGSAGSWMGSEFERRLCEQITAQTGVPATTTTMAMYDAFRELRARRYCLAAPYPDDMIAKIIATYELQGFSCVRSANLPLLTALEKGRVESGEIRKLVRASHHLSADVIAIVCTNFRGAPLVEELEAELGLPVVDSVAATLWKCLRMLGLVSKIEGWGTLLSGTAPWGAGPPATR